MTETDTSSGFEKTSLYNSGWAQIKRLDELWTESHSLARIGKLDNWNWLLDRVWMELVGDLKEDDDILKKFDTFNIAIGKLKTSEDKDKFPKLYNTLMEKEAFLRRLQNKLGKGTKLVDADEDDFE